MREIYIHLGLHKTASTFLQKRFFPLHSRQIVYLNLRKELRPFLSYILNAHDLEFTAQEALDIWAACLPESKGPQKAMLISDEQLCGSPWNNASDRIRYFDRINSIFPEAKYILFLRNQTDMTESLYLQYIKAGGTAKWKDFLSHDTYPLSFARKAYLRYGEYLRYMAEATDASRIICMFYEDLRDNPKACLQALSSQLGIKLDKDIDGIISRTENKSVPPRLVPLFILTNKLCTSRQHPYLLLPRKIRSLINRGLISVFSRRNRKYCIPRDSLDEFCATPKLSNAFIEQFTHRHLKDLGY